PTTASAAASSPRVSPRLDEACGCGLPYIPTADVTMNASPVPGTPAIGSKPIGRGPSSPRTCGAPVSARGGAELVPGRGSGSDAFELTAGSPTGEWDAGRGSCGAGSDGA